MQVYVDAILEAANAVGGFALVQDGMFDENDSYPALVVGERRNETLIMSEEARLYQNTWQYECYALADKSGGWIALENLTKQFESEAAARGFRIAEERQYEAYISERDVLVYMVVLSKIESRAI